MSAVEVDRNEHLEAVSENIRMGIPVCFADALMAIDYQTNLRRKCEEGKLIYRIRAWLKARAALAEENGQEGGV